MKNILFVLITTALLFASSCSVDDIGSVEEVIQKETPAAVVQSFQINFPDAQEPRWSSNNDLYNANFLNLGVVSGATFEQEGKLLSDWHMLEEAEVPQEIQDYMKINYLDSEILERHKVSFHDDQNKGKINFRLIIKYLDIIHTLDFKPDGTLLAAVSAGKENERHSCND